MSGHKFSAEPAPFAVRRLADGTFDLCMRGVGDTYSPLVSGLESSLVAAYFVAAILASSRGGASSTEVANALVGVLAAANGPKQ